MDKKIIFSLQGNVLVGFSLMFVVPLVYAAAFLRDVNVAGFFSLLGVVTFCSGISSARLGMRHKRRLPLVESAVSALLAYPIAAIFGAVPFWYSGWLPPVDAILETVSDLTSAGVSLLPNQAPYILRLWQSSLMWFGSLIFLVMLVTIMPEVSGCFGMELSLHGGQNFSPIFGQMNVMALRVMKVYAALTLIGVGLFKLAGLGGWDSLSMSMRCISTGGGDFFPAQGNPYVEIAAAFTMLMACGNFLFYHRLIATIPPPISAEQENIFRRGINYVKIIKNNIGGGVKNFCTNSEVKVLAAVIFTSVVLLTFSTYRHGGLLDGSTACRHAFFHVVSFISTTGMHLPTLAAAHDFDRFLIFLMAIIGGCIGSVTGGLKVVRVIVLAKILAAELTKVMHPRMVVSIRVNKLSVPQKIMGRMLGFFFLACLTLFICAAVLSFMDLKFSEAVAMSAACLTNVGALPEICGAENFLGLPIAGKIFCMIILIVGRLEIFALLIAAAGVATRRNFKEW